MAYILNIDTANEVATVSIAKDGIILNATQNETQRHHAAFIHNAIADLVKRTAIQLKDLDAIAVAAGPGSYTGIRVGMATAKGLCFSLKKNLITLNNLEILTLAAQQNVENSESFLYGPMIDARRMEVFTGIFTYSLTSLLHPCSMILNEGSFNGILKQNKVLFLGNGMEKWKAVCNNTNALFTNHYDQKIAMAILSFQFFSAQKFADIAYSNPFYLKDFMDSK